MPPNVLIPTITDRRQVVVSRWGKNPYSQLQLPTLSRISPAGMERGTTATFKLEGRGLIAAHALLFDAPGFTAKILNVTALRGEIKAARPGVDLEAATPLGVKSEAQVEITVSKDVEPGVHWFRYILQGETLISTIMPKEDLGLKNFKHIHNAALRKIGDKFYIIAQAWNPGDFAVLEQVTD